MIGASAMNINPAVLDQAIGLLDLIALVRDPGASKAILEGFVAQREAAEKAQKSAVKIQADTQKQLDELRVFQQKCLDDEARVNVAREACASEQQKLSDARDDIERGRAEVKANRADWRNEVSAISNALDEEKRVLSAAVAELGKQSAAQLAEQTALDVRAAEIEAATEALNSRLAKFRALAGE